jgi:hypothetical protein
MLRYVFVILVLRLFAHAVVKTAFEDQKWSEE